MLIDNPTVRPGQSPAPDPAGGRGEGRDFLREAPSRPWKEGERGLWCVCRWRQWSPRTECPGLSTNSRTPGGAAGKGKTAGPGSRVRTLASRRKLNFSCLICGRLHLCSFRLPRAPFCVLLCLSLGLLTVRVPLAALFPGSAVARLGCGERRGAGRAFQGAGEPADPRHCQEHPPPVRVAGFEGECPRLGLEIYEE